MAADIYPRLVETLPSTLNNGAVIIYNDNLYVGNSSNEPVLQVVNYSAVSSKATPIQADSIPVFDSEDSNSTKRALISSLSVIPTNSGLSAKSAPISEDSVFLIDSENTDAVTDTNLSALKRAILGYREQTYKITYDTTQQSGAEFTSIKTDNNGEIGDISASEASSNIIEITFDDAPGITHNNMLVLINGVETVNENVIPFGASSDFENQVDIYFDDALLPEDITFNLYVRIYDDNLEVI